VVNPFRIGTTVYLRPLDRSDAACCETWINDPAVTRTLLAHRPMNLAMEEQWIAGLYGNEHEVVLGIALTAGDTLIGATGLHQIDFKNRHAQFGIMIGAKGEWGKGYATEATSLIVGYGFDTLNLNRIWLHVYETNAAGIRAYEKVGFRKEGVLRQESYRDGRYHDTLLMGILREEWAARRAG